MLREPKLDDYGIIQEDVDKQGGYKSPSESFTLALIFGVVSMLASIFLRQEIYELLGVARKDTYSFFMLIFFSGIFGMMIGGTIEAIINSIRGKEPKEIKVNKYLRDKESYDKKIREVKRAEEEKQKQILTPIFEARRVQREKEESNLRSIHREKKEYWYSLIGKGVEFENTLAELFKALDYEVDKTPASGDQGIDLILKKDGTKTIVQCKAQTAKVGQPIVRDLYGTMMHVNASKSILATINGPTKEAKQFARGKPIRILTPDDYIDLQEKANVHFKS